MTPTLMFVVSALVVTLVVAISAIMFSAKRFRPEATLAVLLTVVTIGGWAWRMPQGWRTISQIAWRYRLKTRQVHEVANKLGIRAFRRGALVPASQQKKMHPELIRLKNLKKQKAVHESSAAKDSPSVYESSDENSGFIEEADRMQFSAEELMRHLQPSIADDVADVGDKAG